MSFMYIYVRYILCSINNCLNQEPLFWEFHQNQDTDGKDGQILNHNLVFLHKRCQIKFSPYLVYVTKGHGSRPTVVLYLYKRYRQVTRLFADDCVCYRQITNSLGCP